jgi:hypothetical protein
MRSVIIAEIYCKALRRRDMSGKIAAAMPNPGAEADSGLAPPMLEDAAEGEKVDKAEVNITNLVGVDAFFMGESGIMRIRLSWFPYAPISSRDCCLPLLFHHLSIDNRNRRHFPLSSSG